ncbi:MAG: hypothetical protein V2A63_02815 [Patescibacteria group bacterium]
MRKSAWAILVLIMILAAASVALLVTVGRDRCAQIISPVAGFHPATTILAAGLAQVGSSTSVGELPDWTKSSQEDLKKVAVALAAGDLEAGLSRLVAINDDVKRAGAGHSLNELGGVLLAQLIPAILAGFLASGGLLPLATVLFGGTLLGLAGRLGVSPLGLLRGWSFFILAAVAGVVMAVGFVPQPISAAGLLVALATGTAMLLLRAFVPMAITVLLIAGGIALRVWLGGHPELMAFITEGLIWTSAALAAGMIFSFFGGRSAANNNGGGGNTTVVVQAPSERR